MIQPRIDVLSRNLRKRIVGSRVRRSGRDTPMPVALEQALKEQGTIQD